MPRIRTIKPDAFTSDSLSTVSVLARWTFAGLWTYCDDDGRARNDVRLIKAALFPIDNATSLAKVTNALNELVDIGAVCLYSAAGRDYLHCPKWGEHQRVSHPTASKIPACPEHSGENPEDYMNPPETLRPERKGKEQGRGTPTTQSRGSERFPDFWAAYPRRVDKGHAEKAFAKAIKGGADPKVIIDAATLFAASFTNSDPKFIPYPATWLNGKRWDDQPDAPASPRANGEGPDDWMRR
jgi:hypothetical protein